MKSAKTLRLTIVAGARPNFMKIAPLIKAIDRYNSERALITYRLVHTGQHYDRAMSGEFFEQLGIPDPDSNLCAGGGTQAEQTAEIMVRFEMDLLENPADLVLVVGDVNSTMACTIAAKKLCVAVGHVEAGIRSGDMTMPEEINRIVTDSICDLFFTTSRSAGELLKSTGVDDSKIHFVGNTMIDTLLQNLEELKRPPLWDEHSLEEKEYFLLTLHRPHNVDSADNLTRLLDSIADNSRGVRIVFPVHPRTRKVLETTRYGDHPALIKEEPLGYHQFIYLLKNSKAVVTDSGGITEEATVLDVPCLTLRDSTERPETIEVGTNELVGTDPANIPIWINKLLEGNWKQGNVPELWDGKASERIVSVLRTRYGLEVNSGL